MIGVDHPRPEQPGDPDDRDDFAPAVYEAPPPTVASPRRWKRIVLLVLASLALLCAIGAGTLTALAYPRSLDLPTGTQNRFGFYGHRGPTAWRCSDGHDHWSIPFWMGSLVFGAIGLVVLRLALRRAPSA